ncbi:PAS domain-containing protein [Agrobacterium rubi]|uniref:PAS domain-containing protein n=1 Tax=Agrobacterium rubi TaxID=28099 RepID=UPI0015728B9D|nr:PAS domain-containing protein [Agrobacterium rubi]NTF07580.1 PAS domain-containing protein [Agrobacterium rubi]NTF19804.1 PAS domain-containing protein [Agrobacterium rubi]NTF26769.1 PAS domain-containing protein [Agrobacterium rubi]
MEAQLQEFFAAFSLKCMQLKQAVACGHDDLVRVLDKELEPIIADILEFRAQTREDAHMQLQFLNGLIRDEAEDRSMVTRRSAAMSMLIDRYFRRIPEDRDGFAQTGPGEKPFVFEAPEQPLFNEAILDCLPDRVAVITRDYRYLYANQANARFLKRTPLSMIGCHVSEFIGEDSFNKMAKTAFDRCFKGATVDYIHHGHRSFDNFSTRCRMTPLRGVNNEVFGAVVVLQDIKAEAALECN